MGKVKIRISVLGHLPYFIDQKKIKKWESELFELVQEIGIYAIVENSDGDNWEFSDRNITSQLPKREDEDILILLLNVPLQDNYFARRFTDNRVCVTYNEMTEILRFNNIPLENLLFRVLYSVSFVYRRYGDRLPSIDEPTNFSHDETRGGIFDMNGIKSDIIYSLNKPQLCHSCVEVLTGNKNHRIDINLINKVQKELKRIRKTRYYQILDFIKKYPVLSIIISSAIAVVLGIIGSIIASIIWEWIVRGH